MEEKRRSLTWLAIVGAVAALLTVGLQPVTHGGYIPWSWDYSLFAAISLALALAAFLRGRGGFLSRLTIIACVAVATWAVLCSLAAYRWGQR